MDFISNSDTQINEMLKSIGIKSIEELFSDIPESLKIPKPTIDDGLSESEGLDLMQKLAQKNSFASYDSYLGGGAYEHYVPAIVASICSKSEFLTSYTPYQAEASQGMLQIIFEYQSAICALTGMDVCNASLYDGASACAEACLMAMRLKKEKNVLLISESLNPHYRGLVNQYLKSHSVIIIDIPFNSSLEIDSETLDAHLASGNVIGFLTQSPNFFGTVEKLKPISEKLKQKNALFLLASNPLSYGIFASAQELDVDIAIGDSQPFGLPLAFGGPYVGYLACKSEFVRQMPGRIVGETVDSNGKRGFVLTLQAREQHIRREKATSNICTNQALAALATLVAIMWYGKQGVKELSLTNYQRACYLKENLKSIPGTTLFNPETTFNEFVVKFDKPLEEIQCIFRKNGIEPGISLNRYYPALKNSLLIAVTETKTKQQLDKYIEVAKECCK